MLTHLSLKDFVIVPQLSLEIEPGLTVLTGETGAGKSILIDALGLVLGDRADTGVIREGAKSTDISAIFEVSEKINDYLKGEALVADDADLIEETVIVRRTIDRSGRSRAWINGISVTAAQLRNLGEQLLDIHGQHAHQSLLKLSGQLSLLDEYGAYRKELCDVKETFNEWKAAATQLEQAKLNAKKLADEAERLAWVYEELSEVAPKENEWEELNNEHRRLANAHDILEELDTAAEELSQADASAIDILSKHASALESLATVDDRLGQIAAQLNESLAIAEDAVRELERYRDRTDLDESRFEEVDARVSLYFNAARKFHVLPETLYEKLAETEKKLKALQENADLEALQKAERDAWQIYKTAAMRLSQLRRQTAKDLSQKVTDAMQSLAMKGGSFEVILKDTEPSALGLEHCEFLVAGHTGVTPRALTKVASGGELSRISLAIAVITSSATPVDTLIFDEVDSGISGAVADVVGKLLKTLSLKRQVLCVTHLPQVAAYGKNHLHVSKAEENATTVSHVNALTENGRIQELARMLGGEHVTEKALENAKELLQIAQKAEH